MKEIIFALPPSTENTAELYDYYKKSNCKIKIYDYPSFQTAGKKRQLREFEIEDLLFRKPIEIYDLAKNMINLSAAQNIEIIETGLRPGEKLYEELLVRTDELDTTENDLIFVEKEKPISYDGVEQKLSVLKNAVNSKNNDLAREALRFVIPTFKSPEEVNKNAEESMEMNIVKTI